MRYSDIDEVREANERGGRHFFEESTLRFFDSIIEPEIYSGRFFVTSEKGPDEIRRWTVRRARRDGTIATCGEFQGHESADLAHEEAGRLGMETP